MKLHRLAPLFLLVAFLAIAGCKPAAQAPNAATPPAPGAPAATANEVRVFVPCGMIIPMRALGDAFMVKHPDIKVVGIFDNAGVIVKRISQKGEKGDLMVSPGRTEIGKLEAAGFIRPDTTKAIGDFELVCIVPANSTLDIKKPEDLKKAKTMGSPDPEINSVGTSGKEALTKLGLWDALKPKMVFTEHAIQAYTMVAGGKADAAICYRNCPLETNPEKLAKSKVRIAFSFPKDSYTKEQCLIGTLRDSPNPAAAQKYMDFITSPEGLKILADHGMTGCLSLAGGVKGSCAKPATATAAAAVDTSKAVVKVVAYYPDNDSEDHQAIKKAVLGLPAKYHGKVSSEFVDFTSDEGFKKWQAAGLTCGGFLINGEQTYSYDKGGKVEEITFKQAQGGEWTFADLDAVVQKLIKEKSK
jgi:molybdate transport system substrate-binding protein